MKQFTVIARCACGGLELFYESSQSPEVIPNDRMVRGLHMTVVAIFEGVQVNKKFGGVTRTHQCAQQPTKD